MWGVSPNSTTPLQLDRVPIDRPQQTSEHQPSSLGMQAPQVQDDGRMTRNGSFSVPSASNIAHSPEAVNLEGNGAYASTVPGDGWHAGEHCRLAGGQEPLTNGNPIQLHPGQVGAALQGLVPGPLSGDLQEALCHTLKRPLWNIMMDYLKQQQLIQSLQSDQSAKDKALVQLTMHNTALQQEVAELRAERGRPKHDSERRQQSREQQLQQWLQHDGPMAWPSARNNGMPAVSSVHANGHGAPAPQKNAARAAAHGAGAAHDRNGSPPAGPACERPSSRAHDGEWSADGGPRSAAQPSSGSAEPPARGSEAAWAPPAGPGWRRGKEEGSDGAPHAQQPGRPRRAAAAAAPSWAAYLSAASGGEEEAARPREAPARGARSARDGRNGREDDAVGDAVEALTSLGSLGVGEGLGGEGGRGRATSHEGAPRNKAGDGYSTAAPGEGGEAGRHGAPSGAKRMRKPSTRVLASVEEYAPHARHHPHQPHGHYHLNYPPPSPPRHYHEHSGDPAPSGGSGEGDDDTRDAIGERKVRRAQGKRPRIDYERELSAEELGKYFHLQIDKAARRLDVGSTTLKKWVRKLHIRRWPFRQVTAAADKLLDREKALGFMPPVEDKVEFEKLLLPPADPALRGIICSSVLELISWRKAHPDAAVEAGGMGSGSDDDM